MFQLKLFFKYILLWLIIILIIFLLLLLLIYYFLEASSFVGFEYDKIKMIYDKNKTKCLLYFLPHTFLTVLFNRLHVLLGARALEATWHPIWRARLCNYIYIMMLFGNISNKRKPTGCAQEKHTHTQTHTQNTHTLTQTNAKHSQTHAQNTHTHTNTRKTHAHTQNTHRHVSFSGLWPACSFRIKWCWCPGISRATLFTSTWLSTVSVNQPTILCH